MKKITHVNQIERYISRVNNQKIENKMMMLAKSIMTDKRNKRKTYFNFMSHLYEAMTDQIYVNPKYKLQLEILRTDILRSDNE